MKLDVLIDKTSSLKDTVYIFIIFGRINVLQIKKNEKLAFEITISNKNNYSCFIFNNIYYFSLFTMIKNFELRKLINT